MLSSSKCIPWMTVGLVESVAIVILNLCTIIVLIRNRNLRKRSTYLVINLAVIDMFVGLVAAYILFYFPGVACSLWNWHSIGVEISSFIGVLVLSLVFGSFINITIIALERMHATFFPFKHRVLKNWVYGLIIAVVWVTSGLLTIASSLLLSPNFYVPFILIGLLIICVSYTSIVIKVRCGAQPQHHGATSRERKLTTTLLIVTVVSLLVYLPVVIAYYVLLNAEILDSLSFSVSYHLINTFWALVFASSLVNPILYAIRMPEYRSALLAFLSKRPRQQRQVAVFPLRDM